jgi:hypothetical protein
VKRGGGGGERDERDAVSFCLTCRVTSWSDGSKFVAAAAKLSVHDGFPKRL